MLALVMNVQRWKRELVAHQHTTRFSEGIVCSFLLHREYVEERIGKYGRRWRRYRKWIEWWWTIWIK